MSPDDPLFQTSFLSPEDWPNSYLPKSDSFWNDICEILLKSLHNWQFVTKRPYHIFPYPFNQRWGTRHGFWQHDLDQRCTGGEVLLSLNQTKCINLFVCDCSHWHISVWGGFFFFSPTVLTYTLLGNITCRSILFSAYSNERDTR